ncbi:N-acetylmuramoyl-L-alanine amidase-like domain-containing protein, partial [Yersinia kristensenii]
VIYIPAEFINEAVVSQLKTGDYIGIYTKINGLDVTHTGIFIMTPDGPMLRNASSLKSNMKVVDSPFIQYVKDKPGIIVLRAL